MVDSFGKRLQFIRKKLNMGQREFALLAGVKHAVTVSRWENDKQTPDMIILTKLVNLYGVNMSWLLTGNGEIFLRKEENTSASGVCREAWQGITYYENAGALAEETEAAANTKNNYYKPEYFFGDTNENLAALKIFGDPMEPTIKNGDTVLINISKESKIPEADGIYALKIGETAIIRRYAGAAFEGMKFSPDNNIYPKHILQAQDVAVKIIGRVTAVIFRSL